MTDVKIDEVVNIVRDAGGTIIGRTRLQKIAYFLYATGLDNNFQFAYKHYGPFSEELASSAKFGALLGALLEHVDQTNWGATYSTYTVQNSPETDTSNPRQLLASIAANTDSIVLELAATAVFLSHDGYNDPWDETTQRKPEKSSSVRLQSAKELLKTLSDINVPTPIPDALVD